MKICSVSSILYTRKNRSPNNGILLTRVLRPKLLNSPFGSCFFTNLNFLFLQSAHFDCIINLPLFVLKIFEFNFPYFFYTSYNKFLRSFIKYISKEKNILLTVLTHIRRLFYQKLFYLSDTQHILILLLPFCLISRLVFLDVYIQCVFYSCHNKFACFVIWENYFFFILSLTIYFCSCVFAITQFYFTLSTLFVIFTSCDFKLSV